MKKQYGAACALLHIGACFASIGPSLVTVDQEVLTNTLDGSDRVDNPENDRLCRAEGAMGDIDPDINEETKLRVVRLIQIVLIDSCFLFFFLIKVD